MWARLSIIAGLLAGVAVAVLVLGGLLFLGPGPTPAVNDPPSSAVPSASPSVVMPSPTATPTASPSASPSPTPSGSAAASPSASAARSPSASAAGSAALFDVGEAAPRLVVPKVGGGIVRDGALGGIGPDDMARGLGKILPGVKVTP